MKKWLSILLVFMMMFTLTACGGGGEADQQEANNNEAVEQQQEEQQQEEVEGFAMPTLNSYDIFPAADYWTALGLAEDFTIDIVEMEYSSKNSIYPLDAKDGNMFDCVVADNKAAYQTLADSLWNAGIKGSYVENGSIVEASERGEIDMHDIDVHVYSAYWMLNDELMHIEMRARDGSNRINITVRYAPEV